MFLLVTLKDGVKIEVRSHFYLSTVNVDQMEALRRIEEILTSGAKFVKVQRVQE